VCSAGLPSGCRAAFRRDVMRGSPVGCSRYGFQFLRSARSPSVGPILFIAVEARHPGDVHSQPAFRQMRMASIRLCALTLPMALDR
jgi:hypothetical protein